MNITPYLREGIAGWIDTQISRLFVKLFVAALHFSPLSGRNISEVAGGECRPHRIRYGLKSCRHIGVELHHLAGKEYPKRGSDNYKHGYYEIKQIQEPRPCS